MAGKSSHFGTATCARKQGIVINETNLEVMHFCEKMMRHQRIHVLQADQHSQSGATEEVT
jgi:hypothetical protein